jgi:MFS family permease
MSVFAKKKNAFEPSLEVSISVMLFLAALVYALCFGNPYHAIDDASKIMNLSISSWILGLLGISLVLDFWIFYGSDFKDPKIPNIISLSTGVFSFVGILIGIILYWQKNSWNEVADQAPRFAACLLFLIVSLLSVLYRFLIFDKKPFIDKDPLSNKSLLLLAGSGVGLAISFFPLAEFASDGSSLADYFSTLAYCTTGIIVFVFFVGMYFMNKAKDQEQNLCKTSIYSIICGIVICLITLGVAIYSWVSGLIVYQIFYWSIFSYLAIALIFGGEAFYFIYVNHSLNA